MPDQRQSQLQNIYSQQTSHHASATSEDEPSLAPRHAVIAGPGTDAATEYDFPPRQQPLDTAPEQGVATTEVPDSEPLPPPLAWSTGDELSLDAAAPVEYRSLSSTAGCPIANGEPIAG